MEYEYKAVHLVKDGGEQHSEDYKAINPMEEVSFSYLSECTFVKGSILKVPAFEIEGNVITQSMAIMEFLEEFFPDAYRLLPTDPFQRSKVMQHLY